MILEFIDDYNDGYNLLSRLLDFGAMRILESKTIRVVLKSEGVSSSGVIVRAIRHPSMQIGTPELTYGACTFSLLDGGPFLPILDVGYMGASETKDIYVRWTIPDNAIPGYAEFAIKADGVSG